MIYIGIGSNLASEKYGTPWSVCQAALLHLRAYGTMTACSSWYESAPVPVSDQPWFVNGVIGYETALEPASLLEILHSVEKDFGRIRHQRDEARILDLDLLAYDDIIMPGVDPGFRVSLKEWSSEVSRQNPPFIIPHPRMDQRSFVLLPLRDIAPHWVHPVSGQSIDDLITRLPAGQDIRLIPSAA